MGAATSWGPARPVAAAAARGLALALCAPAAALNGPPWFGAAACLTGLAGAAATGVAALSLQAREWKKGAKGGGGMGG